MLMKEECTARKRNVGSKNFKPLLIGISTIWLTSCATDMHAARDTESEMHVCDVADLIGGHYVASCTAYSGQIYGDEEFKLYPLDRAENDRCISGKLTKRTKIRKKDGAHVVVKGLSIPYSSLVERLGISYLHNYCVSPDVILASDITLVRPRE